MRLTVKTLKGGKFQVECEASNTVADVKRIIETTNSELPAEHTKLIHSGKVLKDEDVIESCGIKPNDFLVVMVTKPKKPAAAEAPAPSAPAATPSIPAPSPAPTDATSAVATTTATSREVPTAAAAGPAEAAAASDEFPAEIISNLTGLGFPETEVRHCLRAANGNPDVAVEFLTNGIPAGVQVGGGGSAPGDPPLQALRNHPQFNALRRLVQSNPQMLQQVLTQIGQQQPDLLQEINANQAAFLEMMNEPVDNSAPAAPSAPRSAMSGSRIPGGLPGMANPMHMNEIIQNMSPEELNQMAATMGVTADQLRATAQLVGQMPPDQFQEHMMQAMQQMPAEQLQEYMLQAMQQGGGMGDGGGGGMLGGPQILRLTEEEMAAVDRLTEMGFDRAEAAQAFLACDKNEALAANLLMDSMADGGGAFGFGSGDDHNHDVDDDADDEMYD